jgi:3-oxoacyl-[acyl-carrier protein] reductase
MGNVAEGIVGDLRKHRELDGKVAIVTGAARHIGCSIARTLSAAGAAVTVNFATSRDQAEETANGIVAEGGQAFAFRADVTSPDEVRNMVEATLDRFGRIDFLVNSAAIRNQSPFLEMSLDEWHRVLGVVLDGAFLCSQACAPHIIRQGGGAIVNIGGQGGHKGAADRAHVVTAKAGIAGLTKALAHDLASHGITVNCVAPGGIPDRKRGRNSRATTILGRHGLPEEVAAMVRVLCGPESRYITGQTIHVNGGGSMW